MFFCDNGKTRLSLSQTFSSISLLPFSISLSQDIDISAPTTLHHQAGIKKRKEGGYLCEFKNYKDLPQDVKVCVCVYVCDYLFLSLSLFLSPLSVCV